LLEKVQLLLEKLQLLLEKLQLLLEKLQLLSVENKTNFRTESFVITLTKVKIKHPITNFRKIKCS